MERNKNTKPSPPKTNELDMYVLTLSGNHDTCEMKVPWRHRLCLSYTQLYPHCLEYILCLIKIVK